MTDRGSGRRIRRAWAAATIAVTVAWALTGCTSFRAATSAATAPGGRPIWLLARSALALLAADPAVRAQLGWSRVDEILQPGQLPVPRVDATLVVTFSALAALRDALAGDRLPAGTSAVLYDPEAWSYTPAAEQRHPVRAAALAAALAHAHGLKLIVAPALNLVTVLAPGSSAPRWQRFLKLRLAARIGAVADIIDLQAQSLERGAASYASFVRAAAGQARAANPRVTVLAGLSTNPPGAVVDSQQLIAAIQASRPAVGGYWLNIPSPGPRCPTCNAARPDVGIETLLAVATDNEGTRSAVMTKARGPRAGSPRLG
jgi:hypothetical protein